jgi:hypothetical protein
MQFLGLSKKVLTHSADEKVGIIKMAAILPKSKKYLPYFANQKDLTYCIQIFAPPFLPVSH